MYNASIKKRFTVVRDPELEKIVAETKEWLGEKTDSKAIAWIMKWGYGRLGLKK